MAVQAQADDPLDLILVFFWRWSTSLWTFSRLGFQAVFALLYYTVLQCIFVDLARDIFDKSLGICRA